MNVVTRKCYVDDSAKVRYDMILGIYLLTYLGLSLQYSERVIKEDDGPFKGSTAPMVDLGTYIFKYLNIGEIKPKYFFRCLRQRSI